MNFFPLKRGGGGGGVNRGFTVRTFATDLSTEPNSGN